MKKIAAIIVVLLGLIYFSALRNDRDSEARFYAYFYTTSDPRTKCSLFVEGEYKGILPYIPDSLTWPGNTSVKKRGFAAAFPPGKYEVIAKDAAGHTVCEGTIKLVARKGTTRISNSWEGGKCKVEIVWGERN